MPNVTTCSRCTRPYEAGSEEQAAEPDRLCPWCVGPRSVARYQHPNHQTKREREECSICDAQTDVFSKALGRIGRALDALERGEEPPEET